MKTTNNELITITDLWKTYHTGDTFLNALKGINLTVSTGEFTAIMGASG